MNDEYHADERVSPGRALAEAREARGYSVADVASAINLRETVVRAIERDDFALCGGHVYARGHVRAYARQVGLEPGALLAAYTTLAGVHPGGRPGAPPREQSPPATPGGQPVAPLSVPARARRSGDVPLERGRPNWALVVGTVLAAVVVVLVVQLVGDLQRPGRGVSEVAAPVTTSPSSPSSPARGPSVSASGGATSPPTVAAPGATRSPTPTSPVAGVAVALRATGESWVSVRDAAGRTVFSGLLGRGDARRFRDSRALRLTLGNAGAVQLTVNGKLIGSAGGDGQVVRLRFGPGDPA